MQSFSGYVGLASLVTITKRVEGSIAAAFSGRTSVSINRIVSRGSFWFVAYRICAGVL